MRTTAVLCAALAWVSGLGWTGRASERHGPALKADAQNLTVKTFADGGKANLIRLGANELESIWKK
ncbi:MAG TPA: hypothetical protein VM431_10675 [Phycisphaerae bacterium]|nr:hypothetical protein [Phycisphaerae bacterium]